MPDATEKKYVSLDGLNYYDTKIKKFIGDSDTTTLNSANSYANGLAENYDAAGAAATALADAKIYADGKDTDIAAAKTAADNAKQAADAEAARAQGAEATLTTAVNARARFFCQAAQPADLADTDIWAQIIE